jgi:hypothetical protein
LDNINLLQLTSTKIDKHWVDKSRSHKYPMPTWPLVTQLLVVDADFTIVLALASASMGSRISKSFDFDILFGREGPLGCKKIHGYVFGFFITWIIFLLNKCFETNFGRVVLPSLPFSHVCIYNPRGTRGNYWSFFSELFGRWIVITH